MSSNHQPRKSWPRRLRKSHKGVSEIIGTILTVSITVVLFAGIMLYVGTMPQPKGTTSTSFTGQTTYVTLGGGLQAAYINITQMGGQVLSNSDTKIVLTIGSNTGPPYSLSAGGLSTDWAPGQTWSVLQPNVPSGESVQALVYLTSVGDVIWQGSVSDSSQGNIPTMQNKGIYYSNNGMPTYNSPIFVNTSVKFFVLFSANQGFSKLNTGSVTMDGASIGLAPLTLIQNTANPYLFESSSQYNSLITWTGNKVGFTYQYSSQQSPVFWQTLVVLSQGSGGNGGSGSTTNDDPTPNMIVNLFNGYGIYSLTDWTNNHYQATPKYAYNQGEKVVFVAVSATVANLQTDRSFIIYNSDGSIITAKSSSPTTPLVGIGFEKIVAPYGPFTGGYYVYNITVDTTGIVPGLHPVRFQLVDNSQPVNRLIINSNITVKTSAGVLVSMATLKIFASADDRTNGITATAPFTIHDKMYLSIAIPFTSPTESWISNYGSITVSSFDGGKQVDAQPVSLSQPDAIVYYEPPKVTSGIYYIYNFRIDLTNSSDGVWPLGTNSYTVAYNPFQTTLQNYVVMNTTKIIVPMFAYDMATNGGSTTDIIKGMSSNFEFFPGEYRWMRSQDIVPLETLQKKVNPAFTMTTYNFCKIADIDADGTNEVVSYQQYQDGNAITVSDYFQGNWWCKAAVILPSTAISSADDLVVANLNFDNYLDIIYRTSGSNIINRIINMGSYWQEMATTINVYADMNNEDLVKFVVQNLTLPGVISKGCSIVAITDETTKLSNNMITYVDAYNLIPTVKSKQAVVTTSTGGSSQSPLKLISLYSSGSVLLYLLDSAGGLKVDGAYNPITKAFVFSDGTMHVTGKAAAISMVAGRFLPGADGVTMTVGIAFMMATEVYFYANTGSGWALTTLKISSLDLSTGASDHLTQPFKLIAACDLDRDGRDDLVMADNIWQNAADPPLTGFGMVRVAWNSGVAGELDDNVRTIAKVFATLNCVGVGPAQ